MIKNLQKKKKEFLGSLVVRILDSVPGRGSEIPQATQCSHTHTHTHKESAEFL